MFPKKSSISLDSNPNQRNRRSNIPDPPNSAVVLSNYNSPYGTPNLSQHIYENARHSSST